MSLVSPNIWDTIKLHKKLIGIILACVAALGVLLWFFDVVGDWNFNRGQSAKKEQIANTTKEIANIQTEISGLELKKAEKLGQLERDTEELHKDIFGREEAKEAVNQAIANFERAVNSNSNVDRTAEDIERKLRELEP